jgi:hypothetical protein
LLDDKYLKVYFYLGFILSYYTWSIIKFPNLNMFYNNKYNNIRYL